MRKGGRGRRHRRQVRLCTARRMMPQMPMPIPARLPPLRGRPTPPLLPRRRARPHRRRHRRAPRRPTRLRRRVPRPAGGQQAPSANAADVGEHDVGGGSGGGSTGDAPGGSPVEKTEEEQAQERAEEARRINARIAESRKRAEIGGGKDTVANAGSRPTRPSRQRAAAAAAACQSWAGALRRRRGQRTASGHAELARSPQPARSSSNDVGAALDAGGRGAAVAGRERVGGRGGSGGKPKAPPRHLSTLHPTPRRRIASRRPARRRSPPPPPSAPPPPRGPTACAAPAHSQLAHPRQLLMGCDLRR